MYIQTWSFFSRLKYPGLDELGCAKPAPFRFVANCAEYLCGKICSHTPSATEAGYYGNGMVELYCRWCNYSWEVPVAEMPNKQYLVDLYYDEFGSDEGGK